MKLKQLLETTIERSVKIVGDFEIYKGKRDNMGSYHARNNKTGQEYFCGMNGDEVKHLIKLSDDEFVKTLDKMILSQPKI